MNFAKVLQPVAQSYADALKTLQFNQACNATCVQTDCFDRNNWVFDWSCAQNACQCYLADPNATHQAVDNLEHEFETVTDHTLPQFLQNIHTQIVEAHRAYRLRVVSITQDARNQIEAQVNNLLPLLPNQGDLDEV